MALKGLLIDYSYCTGCHSCEIACQVEHGFAPDRWGIKIAEIGPWQIKGDKWQYSYIPAPTDQCDRCAKRAQEGKTPTCEHHCQAKCIEIGEIAELAAKMTRSHMVLYALR